MRWAPASPKGKTVLLDFWTTWCPPCQADASSIEKLNQKFGNKNLAIIGISVDEDRAIVEKYLKKHPHSFPVVLSSENQMLRAYQIRVLPTYMIIRPDGTFMTTEEGDKGFGKLRKTCKKLASKPTELPNQNFEIINRLTRALPEHSRNEVAEVCQVPRSILRVEYHPLLQS
jgi:thiol-disulfide isomerase/thioredoxin